MLAMKDLELRKNELKIMKNKLFSSWNLTETKKRKGLESYQFQALRIVVKEGGDKVMKNFDEKYRELINKLNSNNTLEALYIGNKSNARLCYQGA